MTLSPKFEDIQVFKESYFDQTLFGAEKGNGKIISSQRVSC